MEIYKDNDKEKLSIDVFNGKDESYIEKLLDEIGNFLDNSVAIRLLKSYPVNDLNGYNRDLLERINKQWKKEKRIMKQSLLKKLQAYIITKVDR